MEFSIAPSPGHRAHLEQTVRALHEHGYPGAFPVLCAAFMRLAEQRGVPETFNVTLTHFWTVAVASSLARAPSSRTLDDLLNRAPELSNTKLPLTYYRQVALFSGLAKRAVIEPDLRALPPAPAFRGGSPCR